MEQRCKISSLTKEMKEKNETIDYHFNCNINIRNVSESLFIISFLLLCFCIIYKVVNHQLHRLHFRLYYCAPFIASDSIFLVDYLSYLKCAK